MKTIKFKTSLKCGGCVQKVSPALNNIKEIKHWKVDLQMPFSILEVETDEPIENTIIEAIKSNGYFIEQI